MRKAHTYLALLLTPLVAMALNAGSATATTAKRDRCNAKRQSDGDRRLPYITLASSARIRVYSTNGNTFGTMFYACWRATGHSHRFAENSGGADDFDASVGQIQVRRRFAAFSYSAFNNPAVHYDRFAVIDVSTGRLVRDITLQTPAEDGVPTGLALADSGAIAYETVGVLHAADASGDRLLATATVKSPITRLHSRSQRISWTQDGVDHAVRLS